MEELHHVGGERSCPGDSHAEASAQPLAHLCEYQPVGQPLLQREAAGHPLSLPAGAARAAADPERPQPDSPAQAAGALDLAERVRVDLLVDARDSREDRRPDGRQSLGHTRDVGDERDGRSAMRRRLVREPAVAVRERQEQQHDVARMVHLFRDAGRGGDEVAVREHAALRRPGRAGRVDQGREVVLLHGLRP